MFPRVGPKTRITFSDFHLSEYKSLLLVDGNTFGCEIQSVDRDMSFRIDIGLAGN